MLMEDKGWWWHTSGGTKRMARKVELRQEGVDEALPKLIWALFVNSFGD
jgi:hypothetical protein